MSKVCECGAEIEFGLGPKGNRIPLEPIRHIYELVGENAVPRPGLFVNHYTTCPKAAEFRKARPAMGPPPDNSALVFDLLQAVMKAAPSLETVQGWTKEQRFEAMEWAAREQAAIGDKDDSQRLTPPGFLLDVAS